MASRSVSTIIPKEIPATLKALDAMLVAVRKAKTYEQAARVLRDAEAIKAIFKEIDDVRLRAGKVIVLASHRIGIELLRTPMAKIGKQSKGNMKLPLPTLAELAGYKMRGHRLKKLAQIDPRPIPRLIEDAADALIAKRVDDITVGAIMRFFADIERADRRRKSRTATVLPDGMEFREGDCRDKFADVPDNSVPLILTDPPYGDEAEPLYRWLAEWSARVLIPGGSLICYTGQSRLDRDIAILSGTLRWWWLLVMLHAPAQRLLGKGVIAGFKPVVWFVKDFRRGHTLVPDLLKSPKRDKDLHNWGQGDGGVSALIEHLTDPTELIVDPFAGTEKWGHICHQMGRRWLGCDIIRGGDTVVHAEAAE